MKIIWCMFLEIWSMTDIIFLILDHFLPFYPTNNPGNQNFEKMKKLSVDIIILPLCTINENHLMYVFQGMDHNRHNFFLILDHFFPFYPPNNAENQNFEKWKNAWKYHYFTQVYHKWQSYDVWFLRCAVQQTEFFVILDYFLPFYLPNSLKNQNKKKKMKKPPGDIIILQ